MSSNPTSRWRIAMDTSLFDDATRGRLVGAIEKVAPTSVLLAIPAIAASFAAIGTKYTALKTNLAAVAGDRAQLKNDAAELVTSRLTLDTELVSLKALVANNATSETQVTGMGFSLLQGATSTRTKPPAPALVIVTTGKLHGKANVTVYETPGSPHGNYVAQVTGNPIGTWASLPGNGKQRKLSGYPTGTQLWVQFAQVRWGLQSDWSTPVLVTIPDRGPRVRGGAHPAGARRLSILVLPRRRSRRPLQLMARRRSNAPRPRR